MVLIRIQLCTKALKEYEDKELPPSKIEKKSYLTVGCQALVKEKHILHLITH